MYLFSPLKSDLKSISIPTLVTKINRRISPRDVQSINAKLQFMSIDCPSILCESHKIQNATLFLKDNAFFLADFSSYFQCQILFSDWIRAISNKKLIFHCSNLPLSSFEQPLCFSQLSENTELSLDHQILIHQQSFTQYLEKNIHYLESLEYFLSLNPTSDSRQKIRRL